VTDMQFFLPNFEDLVDPEYDFMNDAYSPRRQDRFLHDRYAHEFFEEPIFDGMLVSRTVVSSQVEERIRSAGSVHAFYRLNRTVPVMGDCGAFSYRNAERPPYTVVEILKYYEELGFTYGVSIDHLVFHSMPSRERQRRLEITLENAREFIVHHQAGGYRFVPVGIAQGWDPISRRQAIERLLEMGYKHLALGGMARGSDKEIRQTLEAIRPVLPEGTRLHMFGVARFSLLPDFIRLGVTSADSASPMRRAFLGTSADNYWTQSDTKYAAIRVPEVVKGAARKRGIDSTEEAVAKNGVTFDALKELEQQALNLLRGYDQGSATLEETLQTVLHYDKLYGDKRDHEGEYRRTLEDKPWRQCGCNICRAWGIEVVIFRGNNRNRRRGFHNAYVFYERFRHEVRNLESSLQSVAFQPPLGLY
jgi:hypothetical protein